MVYIKHDLLVPRDFWTDCVLAKSASIFCKKLLRYFYDDSELTRRCVSEGDLVLTPNRRNKRRAISPLKSDAIESKLYAQIRTEINHICIYILINPK